MKNFLISLTISLLFLLPSFAKAQSPACPSVTTGPNQTICSGCTNITATIQGTVATTSYSVSAIPYTPFAFNVGTPILIGIDDVWSGVINLPFCFEFYGNTYTQCLIGSNGSISFDLANANMYNTWPISAPHPSAIDPDMLNTINGPWHDIDPSVGGNIYWQLGGTAPCRYLIVSWYQVPMFSCNNLINTQQTVLYETTNIIDVFLQNKPVCNTWNGGAAIEGLNNSTGTIGTVVPGRNFPAVWTATNDGQRFTPTGAPQYTFSWLDPNNNVIGNTTTLNVCPTATTTYTAQVVNQTCNGPITVTATTTVTVGGLLMNTSSTPSSCSGNTGTATVTPTGPGPFTYLWNPSGQNTATATGLASGVYTVTVTDPNGCSGTSTVTVGNPGNITTSVTQTNIQCFGQTGSATVTVTGGTGPFNYNWSPSGGTTTSATGLSGGSYTFTVTDANGCTSSQTIVITAPPQLVLSTTSVTPTACGQLNGAAALSTSGGTGTYTYNWLPSGGNNSSASGLGVGTYTVTVTDQNGCTDSVHVVIPPTNPAVTSFTGIDTTGCAPLCVTFTNTSPSASTCNWAFGDGGVSNVCNPVYCYNTPGTYNVTLTITDAAGCPGSVTHVAMVIVTPQPAAMWSASPQPASVSNPTVYFTDLSANATSWQWFFGDPNNSTSNQQHPNFTYNAPGVYAVTLIVTNGNCVDTITMTVVVEEDFTFYAPNTITPNGDGQNETFLPEGIMWDVSRYELYIYDRWGNRIFESKDPLKGWDGKVQKAGSSGKIVQEDTYVWKVIVYDLHNKKHQFVGHVNVIR